MPRYRTRFLITAILVLVTLHPGSAAAAARAIQDPAADPVPDTTTKKKQKSKVNVGGYVQVFFKARNDANGDGFAEPSVFRAQRVRIEFKGDVTRHVGYDVEIDPRAPDILGLLRDGFITLDYVPHHEIRIGQQKTLFGYENPTSSARLFTVNRAEVSEVLSRGINLRDLGVGVTGFIRLAKGWRFEDAVTLVNGAGLNVQADDTPRKNVWGRVGVRYKNGPTTIRLGVSAASGDQLEPAQPGPPPIPSYTLDFSRFGADFEVDHPRGFFAAEYVTGNDRAPATVPDAGGRQEGYYALLVGKTARGVGPLLRYDGIAEFKRWTVGGYAGLPSNPVSLLINYEFLKDATGKRDDRFYVRLQVRF